MKTKSRSISVILPTYNEKDNIELIIDEILSSTNSFQTEIIIIDDNSNDGTIDLVKSLSKKDSRIRLIRRIGRSGLASAIKEGLLNANSDIAVVMDSDGQHQASDVVNGINHLNDYNYDLVIGSRFLSKANIEGLSSRRKEGSTLANYLSRLSLSNNYNQLTDYMSGCMILYMKSCLPYIYKVDVNGFKFLYELLSVSKGKLIIDEIPLLFKPRRHGQSKLELSILWDFLISFLHTLSFRLLPRRAISFALVGATGVLIQLSATYILMGLFLLDFEKALPLAVIIAASSNYLINNLLTFRAERLSGWLLSKGLLKFLLVASLPVIANIGLATSFYKSVYQSTFLAQLAGIFVVFIWNYVASSRFVWNTP
tara:strand:- start:1441 stop:2547 length:1107 start_codon:yes stop_codon:yes gene_type:complete